MHILVAYGSKRGGTGGLAAMIADELDRAGNECSVVPARDVTTLGGYDAVVMASGPLDDSARTRDIPPVRQVAKSAASIGARGCVTFGGRLAPDARGFPASAVAKTKSGDWRDPLHVARWAATVKADLAHPASRYR